MDNELRQAEKDGNYQRLYGLLNRAGRYDEARDLILDNPIEVSCTVQYHYKIFWGTLPDHDSLHDYNLHQLIERFIAKKVGAAQIFSIERTPVYRVLGGEIVIGTFCNSPLKRISLTCEELHSIKDQIKNHPKYMRRASSQQLADDLQRKQNIQNKFEVDSVRLAQETWNLWIKHGYLPRPEFARAIERYSLQYILFEMKNIAGHNAYATKPEHSHLMSVKEMNHCFSQIWAESNQKRFGIWKRNNKAYIDSQHQT